MDRNEYYVHYGWSKSPFIKSTSLDIPIIGRVDEYRQVCESVGGWDRIIVVTAPIGYGKTTFMNQIMMKKPIGVDYVVSFDAYEPEENVARRIISTLPFWKRLSARNMDRTSVGDFLQKNLGKKRLLILFDEAHEYDDGLFKWLRILNDRADNVFMMFFGLSSLVDRITAESAFRDRKSRTITLKPLTTEQLVEIVKNRIAWVKGKGTAPFTEAGIKRLAESANSVPRLLLENGQTVLEGCAKREIFEITDRVVEELLGTHTYEEKIEPEVEDFESELSPGITVEKAVPSGDFTDELSPTQLEIVKLLMERESMSITELSDVLGKDIRSIGSLIRKLRGLNPEEVKRKPGVPYPLVIRCSKEKRAGRIQYVYGLSDNARRLLAK